MSDETTKSESKKARTSQGHDRLARRPAAVKLTCAMVVGGRDVPQGVVELGARSLWQVEFDFQRRILWVGCRIRDGEIAWSWTSFENIGCVRYEPEAYES
jgi:hypothetical protein